MEKHFMRCRHFIFHAKTVSIPSLSSYSHSLGMNFHSFCMNVHSSTLKFHSPRMKFYT